MQNVSRPADRLSAACRSARRASTPCCRPLKCGWNEEEHAKRRRLARKLVRRYLSGVVRVAQFTAYERLFALWHMAHVPFVYILVVSAIAHVIAVHAY